MDPTKHKEFRFSADGAYVAAGVWKIDESTNPEVCVIRVLDGQRFDLVDASYDFGGHRLELDAKSRTLFTAAYYETGVAAYDFESGAVIWRRRDIKKAQRLTYDALDGVLYCFCERRRTILLTAATGKERPYRGRFNELFVGRDPRYSVIDAACVKLHDRETQTAFELSREAEDILRVAFTANAAVVSWVGGPVTGYDLETGSLRWTYKTEGTHAYCVAPSSNNDSVWIVEQPYQEPPWHRLRRLSESGEVEDEVRCGLGHSFAIAPYMDSVIRVNLSITRIEDLRNE